MAVPRETARPRLPRPMAQPMANSPARVQNTLGRRDLGDGRRERGGTRRPLVLRSSHSLGKELVQSVGNLKDSLLKEVLTGNCLTSSLLNIGGFYDQLRPLPEREARGGDEGDARHRVRRHQQEDGG